MPRKPKQAPATAGPKRHRGLFVDYFSRSIVDENHTRVTVDEARSLWESGEVRDFNLALHRLATRCGWDFDELARQYAEMDKARGIAPKG